jgi:hypothetical protein
MQLSAACSSALILHCCAAAFKSSALPAMRAASFTAAGAGGFRNGEQAMPRRSVEITARLL